MITVLFNKKALILLLVSAVFLVTGCGIKGPPLVPETVRPAPPENLTYLLEEGRVELTWSCPAQTDLSKTVKGFEIFQASKQLSDGNCTDCPADFKLAGTVGPDTLGWSQAVQPGFSYYYRIRAHGDHNVTSSYSNTIRFEYKP